MLKPWQQVSGWGRASNERAIGNARTATTALSRRRVERDEVDLYLRTRQGRAAPVSGPRRVQPDGAVGVRRRLGR